MGSYMGFMSNTRGVALNVSITHVPNLHEDSGCLWSVFARTSSIAFAFLPHIVSRSGESQPHRTPSRPTTIVCGFDAISDRDSIHAQVHLI
jgi:hypothetical protein